MPAVDKTYSPKTYPASPNAAWHHFLFGHVPGYQLDFIIQPLPNKVLKSHHTAWLRPLLTEIDPSVFDTPALAIGNLSLYRDQDRPGTGGIALIYGVRFGELTDHAGRPGAFFSHASVAVGRDLQSPLFVDAFREFAERLDRKAGTFFRGYHQDGWALKSGVIVHRGWKERLGDYLMTFADLPSPPLSDSAPPVIHLDRGSNEHPVRILIRHPDNSPRVARLEYAASLAATLYRSNVQWVRITVDLLTRVPPRPEIEPPQLVIHFIPESVCPPRLHQTLERTLVVDFDPGRAPEEQLVGWLKPLEPEPTNTSQDPPNKSANNVRLPWTWRPWLALPALGMVAAFLSAVTAYRLFVPGPRQPADMAPADLLPGKMPRPNRSPDAGAAPQPIQPTPERPKRPEIKKKDLPETEKNASTGPASSRVGERIRIFKLKFRELQTGPELVDAGDSLKLLRDNLEKIQQRSRSCQLRIEGYFYSGGILAPDLSALAAEAVQHWLSQNGIDSNLLRYYGCIDADREREALKDTVQKKADHVTILCENE
ncbi:MAG: hypothetical protein JNM83_08780 [Myxococcales bacterium]|jgi:hypothetical protein|nr:hypothetical protein [Myxococcales bacterium]